MLLFCWMLKSLKRKQSQSLLALDLLIKSQLLLHAMP